MTDDTRKQWERDVILMDGTVVSNYSEAWRRDCEIRAVLAMPKDEMLAYMALVKVMRSQEAYTRLREGIVGARKK